jgi:SprT protein
MDAHAPNKLSPQAIWTPDQPLPTGRILQELAACCGQAWDEPDLAEQVKVGYNRRLSTTLGRALYNESRIELNPHLLKTHREHLFETLAHELAHLVVHWRYPTAKPHGREFRTLMRAMNLSPKATHNLPVDHLRRRRGKYIYLHRCSDCNYRFSARRTRRDLYCLTCGPSMQWEIARLPNTPAGRRLMRRLMGH